MASKSETPASFPSHTAEALAIKVAEAGKILEPCMADIYSVSVGQQSSGADYVERVLKGLGVLIDDESHALLMAECKTADLVDAFVAGKVPLLRAKRVAEILRPAGIVETTQAVLVAAIDKLTEQPVAHWSDLKLLQNLRADHDQYYDIAETLDKRGNGHQFVIYADEAKGEVDIESTAKMLAIAKKGRTPLNYRVGNCLKKLWRANERPNVMFVECPFHPGTLLIDGYCDECTQNWDGTDYKALQFARLVKEAGEAPDKAPEVKRFFKLTAQGGLAALRDEYEAVAMTFDQLVAEDRLPNLHRRQSGGRAVSDPMNPNRRF